MDKELLRLELIKLCFKPVSLNAADDAIIQAQKLEKYCLGSGDDTAKVPVAVTPMETPSIPKESAPLKGKVSAKKSDNSIFS